MKTVNVGMYADQTGLFTESEVNFDNWVDLDIQEWIVRKWFEEKNLAENTAEKLRIPLEEATFERWLNDVSWGGDTDGLFEFALANGDRPTTGVNKHSWVCYRDENGFKTIVFEGSYDDCRYFGRENGWELDGRELEMWES